MITITITVIGAKPSGGYVCRKRWQYCLSVVVCTLLMCLTYQVSAGIFPLIVLYYALDRWNAGEETLKESVWFSVRSAVCFLAAMLLYRLVLVRSTPAYASADAYSLRELPRGIWRNYKKYYQYVRSDFKMQWLVLCLMIMALFLLVLVIRSKRNRLLALAFGVAAVGAGSALAFGACLVLQKPLFMPRMMYGTGVWMALLALVSVRRAKLWVSAVPAVLLSWCFFIFCFTYGNALFQQAEYSNFRMTVLASDLNTLEEMGNGVEKQFQFSNNVGKAPAVKAAAEHCNILNRFVPSILGKYTWARVYFFQYLGIDNLNFDKTIKLKNEGLPVLKDTMYHTIYGDESRILVTFKKPEG